MSEGLVRARSATVVIAAVTSLISLLAILSGALDPAAIAFGFIPARLSGLLDLTTAAPVWLTPLTATLIHGGFLHLALNLVMLLFVGSQVERVLGASSLIFAYVVGAFVAAGAQWLADASAYIPMVGASGAISALFGIYALLAGRPKDITRSPRLNRAIHAVWLLAAWVLLQWMTQLLAGGQGMMLATPAQIGGFVAGLLLQRPLLLWRYRRA